MLSKERRQGSFKEGATGIMIVGILLGSGGSIARDMTFSNTIQQDIPKAAVLPLQAEIVHPPNKKRRKINHHPSLDKAIGPTKIIAIPRTPKSIQR